MVARRDEVEDAYRALPGETVEDWAEHVPGLLGETLRAAVEEARPELAERAAWLRAALEGSGEDALSSSLRDSLAALGDPTTGDWSDLLARVEDARGKVNLRGGSARNWAEDLQDVKSAMRWLRDKANELRALPRWTSTTRSPWKPSHPCGLSSGTRAIATPTASRRWWPWTISTSRSWPHSCSAPIRGLPLHTGRACAT